jgi:hypothetical protein
MLVILLLFPAISGVIGLATVNNVTESYGAETKITRNPSDTENEDYVILQEWFLAPHLLPISIAASEHIQSPRCRNQSRLYLQELRNFTLWAVQSK